MTRDVTSQLPHTTFPVKSARLIMGWANGSRVLLQVHLEPHPRSNIKGRNMGISSGQTTSLRVLLESYTDVGGEHTKTS